MGVRRSTRSRVGTKEGDVFGRIFSQIFDGTLHEHWEALVTFQQMLILTRNDGVVDMTPKAIANRTGIPLAIIVKGIAVLEAPDPDSRTRDEEGRRIVRVDDGRTWGWRIVNHAKYAAIRSEEGRRSSMSDGYVYYAGDVGRNAVKIGFSKNPWARVADMRTAIPGLVVLAVERGSLERERGRQAEFADLRLSGEWFRFETALKEHVERLAAARSRSVATGVATNVDVDVDVDVSESASADSCGERLMSVPKTGTGVESSQVEIGAGTEAEGGPVAIWRSGGMERIPLADGTEFEASADEVEEWARLFPGVDLATSFRRMRAWCSAHRSRKKTRRGVHAFVVTWLSRDQDTRAGRGRDAVDHGRTPGDRSYIDANIGGEK
jgi:hypothetical protein